MNAVALVLGRRVPVLGVGDMDCEQLESLASSLMFCHQPVSEPQWPEPHAGQ
jgi:hypothetical protein